MRHAPPTNMPPGSMETGYGTESFAMQNSDRLRAGVEAMQQVLVSGFELSKVSDLSDVEIRGKIMTVIKRAYADSQISGEGSLLSALCRLAWDSRSSARVEVSGHVASGRLLSATERVTKYLIDNPAAFSWKPVAKSQPVFTMGRLPEVDSEKANDILDNEPPLDLSEPEDEPEEPVLTATETDMRETSELPMGVASGKLAWDDEQLDLSRTVAAMFHQPRWMGDAICAQTDPEAFFPEKGGSTREAKKVCAECEVRPECLDYALRHDERFGIWGGLSERERRKLKRRVV